MDYVQWADLKTWRGNVSEAKFCGRYFLLTDFMWAHGEGNGTATNAIPNNLSYIAPMQASSVERQQTGGDVGNSYGMEDGSSICEKIFNSVLTGELAFPDSSVVVIYLEVLQGTNLSVDYWAGWADTVKNYLTIQPHAGTPYNNNPQINSSVNSPFVPGIICPFEQMNNKYVPIASVRNCLDNVDKNYPHLSTLVFSFWAKILDNAYRVPTPNLIAWSKLQYNQPFADPTLGKFYSVPVLLLRYAEQSNPPDAAFAGGQLVNLDESNDQTGAGSFMLKLFPYCNNQAESDLSWGFDTNSDIPQVNCITDPNLQFPNDNHLTKPMEYVIKYYRQNPTKNPGSWANTLLQQVQSLLVTDVKFLPVYERYRTYRDAVGNVYTHSGTGRTLIDQEDPQNGLYFTIPHGVDDATFAFDCAANIIKQPPNTPVYFAVDSVFRRKWTDAQGKQHGDSDRDYTDNEVKTLVQQYFTDIKTGYIQYLVNQDANKLEPKPYAIGVYGGALALTSCYEQGITSYYWQAGGSQFRGNPGNWPWLHDNLWQKYPEQTLSCGNTGVDFDASWGDEGGWYVI